MTDNRIEEQGHNEVQTSSHLQSKPQRDARQRRSSLILIMVGGLILVGGLVALLFFFSHSSTPGSTSASSNSNNQGKGSSQCTGERLPVDTIQQETASGLHLTVDQVKTQVSSGKTIAQIATEQGLSQSQLHDVEINALNVANNRWVQLGCISQQDVSSNMQRDTGSADYMDYEFTQWFQ